MQNKCKVSCADNCKLTLPHSVSASHWVSHEGTRASPPLLLPPHCGCLVNCMPQLGTLSKKTSFVVHLPSHVLLFVTLWTAACQASLSLTIFQTLLKFISIGIWILSTGKIIALTIQTSVGRVISLLFNMLSRFVRAFLPRRESFNFMAAVAIHSDF